MTIFRVVKVDALLFFAFPFHGNCFLCCGKPRVSGRVLRGGAFPWGSREKVHVYAYLRLGARVHVLVKLRMAKSVSNPHNRFQSGKEG